MRAILFEGAAKRWSLGVALLAGLSVMLLMFASSISAQSQPKPPAWFYGQDADSYVGAQVKAFNQNGVALSASETDVDIVDSEGGWSLSILVSDATRVTFQIVHSTGTLESSSVHVVDGTLTEVPISDFRVVSDVIEEIGETIPIRIIARLRDDRTPRTFEFSIRINGVDADPPPRLRHHTPSLDRNRWYVSSLIDAGDEYEVQVIACRRDNEDMLFGVRVAGHDDIIPRLHRIGGSHASNNWLQSNEFDIPKPRENDSAIRLRLDDNCSRSALGR